tara:strand:+ start:986 stop:2248 length:1263 start_codon:yes stop_codon:yes gene_type:complete
MSFQAGFFGAARDYMKEKRDAARRENELIIRGIMDGVPQLKERKKIKRQLRELGGQFKTYNLSDDEIGTILRSGNAENILKKMRELDSLDATMKQKIGYDPANVVKFHDGYESSGLTLDQHIDSIVGKLNTGMNLSDALIDSGSKPKTSGLGSLFEPNRSKMLDKRLGALRSVFGDEVLQKARAVQQDDITYGDDFKAGTINIPNPVLQAKIEKSMKEDQTGTFTSSQMLSKMLNYGYGASGGKSTFVRDQMGNINRIYSQDNQERLAYVEKIVPQITAAYRKEVDRNRFTLEDYEIIQERINKKLNERGFFGFRAAEEDNPPGEKITDPTKANEKIQTIVDNTNAENNDVSIRDITKLLIDSKQVDNEEQAKKKAEQMIMQAIRNRTAKKVKKDVEKAIESGDVRSLQTGTISDVYGTN